MNLSLDCMCDKHWVYIRCCFTSKPLKTWSSQAVQPMCVDTCIQALVKVLLLIKRNLFASELQGGVIPHDKHLVSSKTTWMNNKWHVDLCRQHPPTAEFHVLSKLESLIGNKSESAILAKTLLALLLQAWLDVFEYKRYFFVW